jgi:aromatic-L-amino-acid decarboxylase
MMINGLEPSREEWESWIQQVLNFIKGAPAVTSMIPNEILESPIPGGLPKILELFNLKLQDAVPTTSPGFMAYVPGGGIQSAALANFLGNLSNRFTGIEDQASGLVALETQVIQWLCREFGLPETAFGVLTSGGSIANLTALITARVQYFGESGDFSKACVYVSDQVHHSVQKAAFLAGIPKENTVSIQTDHAFKLSMQALHERVQRDRKLGLKPFCIVGSAGTTNTGAIDPLEELAAFCRQQNLWFHIDAAYGGAFVLCESGKAKLKGIELADSITFDPHKGMFLPYGTGGLLVKDRETLLKAYSYEADYLTPSQKNSPASLGLELSREYRGIKIWLPLMLHGAGAFRQALSEKLELTNWLHEELKKLPVQILCRPELSTIVFRPGDISKRVNSYGRVYLSPTKLRGELTSRVCILSFKTHFEQVQACLEDISKALYDSEI